ncbi:hypothetical protein CR513_17784, partial [Mucuna pruriens]
MEGSPATSLTLGESQHPKGGKGRPMRLSSTPLNPTTQEKARAPHKLRLSPLGMVVSTESPKPNRVEATGPPNAQNEEDIYAHTDDLHDPLPLVAAKAHDHNGPNEVHGAPIFPELRPQR